MDNTTDQESIDSRERIAYLSREIEVMQHALQVQGECAERQKQAYQALSRQNGHLRARIEELEAPLRARIAELEARLQAWLDVGDGI